MDLSSNQLSGGIPSSLGDLKSLRSLYLHDNQISGDIPPELGDLTDLTYLNVGTNELTGVIPATLVNLANLDNLDLYNNQLTGTIPVELSSLNNLRFLCLWGNQLTGNIPASLGGLVELQFLGLWSNQLEGNIPVELGNLINLSILYLDGNQLTGTIPAEFVELNNLSTIHVSYNQLTGDIPSWLGNLTSLNSFAADNNEFTGSIPNSIGNLTNLYSLSLMNNRLSGAIPDAIGNLSNLNWLTLSNNKFSGEIPSSIVNLENAIDISLLNNALETSDLAVDTFLESLTPGWKTTQTVPPTNLELSEQNGQWLLTWDPIPFRYNGYYIMSYADNPNGPFIEHGTTISKNSSEYIIDDIAENPGHFYVVQSFTATDNFQKNEITSRYSEVLASDVTPPVITIAYPDIIIEATGECTSVDLGVVTAVDDIFGSVSVTPDQTGPFTEGDYVITWTATDNVGNTSTATQRVGVLPMGTDYWNNCALEGGTCEVPVSSYVRYGNSAEYYYAYVNDSVACSNDTFGDPIFGVLKQCDYILANQADADADGGCG